MRGRKHGIKTLTISQVAWLLGTDDETVLRWADSGIIKAWRNTCRGERRFLRGEIASLLASLGA